MKGWEISTETWAKEDSGRSISKIILLPGRVEAEWKMMITRLLKHWKNDKNYPLTRRWLKPKNALFQNNQINLNTYKKAGNVLGQRKKINIWLGWFSCTVLRSGHSLQRSYQDGLVSNVGKGGIIILILELKRIIGVIMRNGYYFSPIGLWGIDGRIWQKHLLEERIIQLKIIGIQQWKKES